MLAAVPVWVVVLVWFVSVCNDVFEAEAVEVVVETAVIAFPFDEVVLELPLASV